MNCEHCGTPLPDGALFCANCGKPQSTQPTPPEIGQPEPTETEQTVFYEAAQGIISYEPVYAPAPKTKEDLLKTKKKLNKTLTIVSIILAVIIAASATVCILVYNDVLHFKTLNSYFISLGWKEPKDSVSNNGDSPFSPPVKYEDDDADHQTDTDDENTEYDIPKIDRLDANKYYAEIGKIVSVTDPSDSEKLTTGSDTYNLFAERGFTAYPITAVYSIGGEFFDEPIEIKEYSSDYYPVYQTVYINSANEIFTVYMVNGTIMAFPTTYNLQSGKTVQLIISEKDSFVSYDNTTGKFFEVTPNGNTISVKKVSKIDAETLNSLTVGKLGG